MKKVLLVGLALVAGVVAKKRLDQANAEQSLWQEATDTVHKAAGNRA